MRLNNSGPDPEKDQGDELLPNSAAEEFFGKMNHDFRRPKPSEQAVAVALHAIQKMTGDVVAEYGSETPATSAETACPKCGATNSGGNRFCGYCGTLLERTEQPALKIETPAVAPGQHVHHHHHHHHYFSDPNGKSPAVPEAIVQRTEQVSAALQMQGSVTDAEAIQQLVRNWSLYCNAKRLDDLVELYSTDAIVLRPNALPAHGSSEIRQLLGAALQSGLGDVELECADIGIVGAFASLTGISKMLVPIAAGRRNEQAGKYLMVARRELDQWKIVADSWCIDSASPRPAPQPATATSSRTPRK